MSKYPLLDDVQWLQEKYVDQGLSTIDLTRLVGAKTPNSARQALIRAGIPVRSIGDGLRSKRTSNEFVLDAEIFVGSMLGDATMRYGAEASFRKHNKFEDHVELVAKSFFPTTWPEHLYWHKSTLNGIEYINRMFDTNTHKELTPLYHEWYPNGIKVIPAIQLTSKTLLHWFMDDGCSWLRNRGYHEVVIELATHCFVEQDTQRLVDMLNRTFGFRSWKRRVYKDNDSQWRIQFPQSQAKMFFDIIGKCPVPSMQYKWK